jgi:hypothetical protein
MEERLMWEDVVAGRVSLATHVVVVLYAEVLLKVTLPALLLALSIYLTAALELDVWKALEFVVICVLGAWSLAILPLAYQVLCVGLREVGGVSGSASGVSVLPRFLSWAAGILLGALLMVGGFPLAPADLPAVLQWLRYLDPERNMLNPNNMLNPYKLNAPLVLLAHCACRAVLQPVFEPVAGTPCMPCRVAA